MESAGLVGGLVKENLIGLKKVFVLEGFGQGIFLLLREIISHLLILLFCQLPNLNSKQL